MKLIVHDISLNDSIEDLASVKGGRTTAIRALPTIVKSVKHANSTPFGYAEFGIEFVDASTDMGGDSAS